MSSETNSPIHVFNPPMTNRNDRLDSITMEKIRNLSDDKTDKHPTNEIDFKHANLYHGKQFKS